MDPRIGTLIRNGKEVFYAFARGYDRPPVEGSLEAVENALGLRPSRAAWRSYVVTLTWRGQMAESDEAVIVRAKSHSDAIKRGRDWKRDNYGRTRPCELVPCSFRARLAKDWERDDRTSLGRAI